MNLHFIVDANEYTILGLRRDAVIPAWALTSRHFFSTTRTGSELSIVIATTDVGDGDFKREDGWSLLALRGPVPFETTGVAAEFTGLLAARGISVFVVSTYDTDYVLVRTTALEPAVAALEHGGHFVQR